MNQILKLFVTLSALAVFVTAGCKSAPKEETAAAPAGEGSSDLSWVEAQARKARLSNISYDIHVDLTQPENTFTGKSDIQFDLKDVSKPLRLDFFEGKVISLTVNDKSVPVADAKKMYWIELPAAALKEGRNRVTVDFSQAYSSQGQGLHKFTDPQSKEVFLYTQFETFDANRFMPCFDQPDLRSTYALTVEAPAKWEVISTARETSVKMAQAGRKVWTFPKTLPISTYLFSLHAGPYKVWKDQYANIPLRLYARPSLAKYVKPAEFFKVTKQGLKFFETYFNFKYPFKKYDQLIVPEFNAGAMENVGAVTFTERFISRGESTREERRSLAGTILHEMAHMWFGDTVTMKWWNDLWLNESFATFMATQAMAQATEYKEAWQDFFSSEKNWAYWEDGLVTTHPIEAPVNTVKDAFANFDGITYGKGAALLKQMEFYVTPEGFKKGIQGYIAAHAMQNAELKDFIAALQTQTKRDMNLWAARWLRQSGTDTLTAQWTCTGNKLTEITLVNTPSAGAQFRPQAVDVALFKADMKKPVLVRAEMNQATESYKGDWACPAFVYPNYSDYGYASVRLDPVSLKFARERLSGIQDVLLRSQVWDDLWQMVRRTELPLKDYVEVVNAHFGKETDDTLLNQITRTISVSWGDANIIYYWPQNEKTQKARTDFIVKTEAQYLKRFQDAKTADEQLLWLDNFAMTAQTPSALDHLAKWVKSDKLPNGLELDLDRRWMMTRQLTRYRHPAAPEALEMMKKLDTSDRGVRSAMAVEAIQPEISVKAKWVNILKQPKPSVSYAEARAVLNSLFPAEQRSMTKNFEKDFYEYLKANGNSENEIFVESVAEKLAPLSCDNKSSEPFKSFMNQGNRFVPSVTKSLKVKLQEDERCQKIRAASSL